MIANLQKSVFTIIFNSSIFIMLIIGIQNSDRKGKINFLINETIQLPISFIIGSSFIAGSITSSFISLMNVKK